MNIILGIITSLLGSITDSIWKKAVLVSKLPQSLFNVYGPATGLLIIYLIIYFNSVNTKIFYDYKIIFLIFIIAILNYFLAVFRINIYKVVKLSELLPYKNLDKIFVVIFGFILYYGTEKSTSLISFFITLLTIVIIILFTIDFKSLKFSKDILKYFLVKIGEATGTLLIGYIFLKYSTVEYLSLDTVIFLSITIIVSLLQKNSLKLLFTQKKDFYKYRIGATFIGWTGFIIGLYIIESSGLLIATLLSFIGLIFQILSIKFILKDNPEKKQVILAFIVMFMIGIGYYFK